MGSTFFSTISIFIFISMERSARVCVHKHMWVRGGDKYWPFTLRFQAVITGKLLIANDELSSVCKYTEALCTSGPINRKVRECRKYCNSVMEGIHWWVFCCISESCIFGHDGLELLQAAYLQCASQVVLEMCGYTWTVYLEWGFFFYICNTSSSVRTFLLEIEQQQLID